MSQRYSQSYKVTTLYLYNTTRLSPQTITYTGIALGTLVHTDPEMQAKEC